jgi:hypothetical protein
VNRDIRANEYLNWEKRVKIKISCKISSAKHPTQKISSNGVVYISVSTKLDAYINLSASTGVCRR